MTLRDKIERVLSEKREITERPDFRRLSRFYEEMKQAGIVLKRQYDLPPLDTVGRWLDHGVSSGSRQGDQPSSAD